MMPDADGNGQGLLAPLNVLYGRRIGSNYWSPGLKLSKRFRVSERECGRI
jgi:hypothetical protein